MRFQRPNYLNRFCLPTSTLVVLLTSMLLIGGVACSTHSATPTGSEVLDSSYQGPPEIELSSVQTRRLAERVVEYYDARLPMAQRENLYVERVVAAKDALEEQSGERYRYGVYLSNRIHAFALASGDIRLHSGLLDVISADDELLALISCLHTLIRKGYADEAVEQSYNAAVTLDPDIQAALRERPFPEDAIRTVAERTTLYRFSVEQLHACDVSGARALAEIDQDPRAMTRLLQRLARFESGKTGATLFDISRSQPEATARLALLQSSLEKQFGTQTDTEPAEYSTPLDTETEIASSLESGEESFVNNTEEEQAAPTEIELANEIEEQPLVSNNSPQTHSEDTPRIESATLSATANRKTDTSADKAIEPVQTPQQAPQTNTFSKPAEPDDKNASGELALGWYVQMSAEVDPETAAQKRAALQRQNYTAELQVVRVEGVTYSRVLVGPFATQEVAQQMQSGLADSDLADGRPFVRRLP